MLRETIRQVFAAIRRRPAGSHRPRRLRNREIRAHLVDGLATSRQAIEIAKSVERDWRDHAPAFVNAVATVGAFARQQARLQRQLAECSAEIQELRRKLAEARGE